MVLYGSGSVRFSGLGSDNNFDDTIRQLSKIERRQLDQFGRWKKDWQTRLDAFKQVRTEIMELQRTLRGLNSMDKFLIKSTTTTKEEVATATATADAMNSSYDISVGQKARATTWGKELGLHNKTDIINEEAATFKYTYKGKTVEVAIPPNTTVQGFQNLINNHSKNPGVKAQMIQTHDGIIFQLQGMDTGKSSTLVIQEITNIPCLGDSMVHSGVTYKDEESRFTLMGTANVWSSSSDDQEINTSLTETKTFIYTLDGQRYTVDVPPQGTLQGLITSINGNHDFNLASLKEVPEDSGQFRFVLERPDTKYSFDYGADLSSILTQTDISGYDHVVNPGDSPKDYTFTLNNLDTTPPTTTDYKVTLKAEGTMEDLVRGIRLQVGDKADVKLQRVEGTNEFKLVIIPNHKSHRVTVEDGTLEDFAYEPPTAVGWNVSHGCNATVRVNGYPAPPAFMEVASNTIKPGEIIPGVGFTLNGVGDATISVNNDTPKMMENVQSFVDAVNKVRTILMELTKVEDDKQTLDASYAESQFEMQKGAVLTGNYGVQLVSSNLKDAVARAAIGFTPLTRDSDGGYVSGDVFSSLSQIGITTNATQGNANYGLLEINLVDDLKGSLTLQQALEQDPEAVARLFACTEIGNSNSDHFQFLSHVAGITKPGVYDVSYETDEFGNPKNVLINGKEAKKGDDGFTFMAMDGPEKGVQIAITSREPDQRYSGTISIKAGKVTEILGLLEGSEGMLGEDGTLRVLEKNYQNIIDGIDRKLQREDERLQRWERTMINKFARLEATLAQYDGIQKSLESQINQLSSNKK